MSLKNAGKDPFCYVEKDEGISKNDHRMISLITSIMNMMTI
jgi:hypothetical protein